MIIQMIIQIEDDDETTNEVENEIEKKNDDDKNKNNIEEIKNEILTQTQSWKAIQKKMLIDLIKHDHLDVDLNE